MGVFLRLSWQVLYGLTLLLVAAYAIDSAAQVAGDGPVIQAPSRVNTDQETVSIDGKVTATAALTLSADGKPVAIARDGSFRVRKTLPLGKTTIVLVAKDADGEILEEKRISVRRREIAVEAISDVVGNYFALVIGNNEHQHLKHLEKAVNDAEGVSNILRNKYGFEVTTLRNATRYDIVTELNKLRSKLTENDNLLIYYAGHGDLDAASDQGYWLPVDAELNNVARWVSINTITNTIRAMSAKHVLVVADSCYSGTLTRGPEGSWGLAPNGWRG